MPPLTQISIIAITAKFSGDDHHGSPDTLHIKRSDPYKYGRPCGAPPLLPSSAQLLISAKCDLKKEEALLNNLKKKFDAQTKIVSDAKEKFRAEDSCTKDYPRNCTKPPPTFPKHLLYLWPEVFDDSMPMTMAGMMHQQRQDMKHKLKL